MTRCWQEHICTATHDVWEKTLEKTENKLSPLRPATWRTNTLDQSKEINQQFVL